jgi:2-aminoethylphosphonate-pyruvate transaminase
VLFNPGPVLTSPRVKSALVHHDVCHRDSDYSVILRRLHRKLRRVCRGGPEHDIVLISGSGTASMEAALSSCVPPEGKLLVVSNGAFGERFAEIAEVHKIQTVHLRYEWGELIDPQDVDRILADDPEIVATIMCHNETSVGLLNPVQEVGKICRKRDRMYFVDAVSSLAGEDLDVRRDKIDVLISSANKCLHAISGVSFVCVNKRIWPRIESIPPRVYYLDLKRYHRLSEQISQTPFTPAVSNFFALDAALDELLKGGVSKRITHYREINSRMRSALQSMGLELFTNSGHESHTITTIKVPDYITFEELYEELKSRGYIVYACKKPLADRYFQIANMGDLSDEMIQGFLDTLQHVLHQAARRKWRVQARPALLC